MESDTRTARLPRSVTNAEYDAVVYDLDGTLVRLPVDWSVAREDVAAVYESAGLPADGMGLWDLLERAEENMIADRVEATVADHERTGAERAQRLPLADDLLAWDGPAGVCSLNCEAACRTALSVQELDGAVDAVVGRDTVGTWKPDPAPLRATIDRIGADPDLTLFVGDSERDAETARRADVDYRWAYDDGPTRR
jgi:phosphoglycolate phosphatase